MVKLRYRIPGPTESKKYIESSLRLETLVLLLQETLSQEQQSSLWPHEEGTSAFACINKDLIRRSAALSSTAQAHAMGNMSCKTNRTPSMVPGWK
jgi:hypothetical protein